MGNKWSYPPQNVVDLVARELGTVQASRAFGRVYDALQAASVYGPGAELTSWYRDPAQIGARRSQHRLGLAIDLYAANLNELGAHLREAVKGGYVKLEPPGTPGATGPHVHFQALPPSMAAFRVTLNRLYSALYGGR